MRERKEGGDARAHGITHHVGAAEIEMIQQRPHVLGHPGAVIRGRVVELARAAVPAIVERDDASAGLDQRRHPAGINPVHLRRRGKAVHEHDRVARPFIEKRDVDAVVGKALHVVPTGIPRMTPEVARIFALLPRSGKPGWRRGRPPLPLAASHPTEPMFD